MKLSTGLTLLACASTSLAFAPAAVQQRASSALNMGSDTILTKKTGQSSLDPAVIAKYQSLGYPGDSVLAEYVWVDADGNTRSKTRTLPAKKVCILFSFICHCFDRLLGSVVIKKRSVSLRVHIIFFVMSVGIPKKFQKNSTVLLWKNLSLDPAWVVV